jgi:hypothetical protein
MPDPKVLINLAKQRMVSPGLKTAGLLRGPKFIDTILQPIPVPSPPSPPPPTPAPPPVAAPPAPAVNGQQSTNPFLHLPFPSPGDRIRAQDFQTLSQCLQLIYEISVLTGTLIGTSFGDAKLVLASERFGVDKVMSVFGTELASPQDATFDDRRVVQVNPIEYGERRVSVIVTEAVETRRFVPNLLNLSYKEASERLRMMVGDVSYSGAPLASSQLVGLSLGQAKDQMIK